MNSRGQLWSLDVVLAAVVFTLALGLVLSQSELQLFYDQQDTHNRSLWDASLFGSNMIVSKPDVGLTSGQNIRCGPSKWSTDNDLSWMENCFILDPENPTASALGIPPGYSISFTGPSSVPANTSYYSITRMVLLLPPSIDAQGLRQCMDGACPGGLVPTPITLTVWRTP